MNKTKVVLAGLLGGYLLGSLAILFWKAKFGECPFISSLDCFFYQGRGYVMLLPIIGAFLGPFVILVLKDLLKKAKK